MSTGITETEILEAENATGLKFPASYRKFISETDGHLFEDQGVKVMSLAESLGYFSHLRKFSLVQKWGCFPILDNDDSNPWCICCEPPLAGYIVQIMHDDAPQIKFRSLDAFFAAIQTGDGDDLCFLDDLKGDFYGPKRIAHDVEAAKELLKMASNLSKVDRPDACRFAMWLLGDEQVDQIAQFLADEDVFVARDATNRLTAMKSPKAMEALQTDQRSLAAFIERSRTLLLEGGIQCSVENHGTIRLSPPNKASILLDMKTFYAKKKNPNAEKEFLERVKSIIAAR
jgi:hypothetical protein